MDNDKDFNTYEENEFEQSEDFGYDSKREQYRNEFNDYLEAWNNDFK